MAYTEACRNSRDYVTEKNWSHPVVKYAFHYVGSHNLANKIRQNTFPDFEESYLSACELFHKGELKPSLPPPEGDIFVKRDQHSIGKYTFARDGILKQYERVSTREEAMAIASSLLGKGNSALHKIIKSMEAQHKALGYD